jgi:hypothetical protein
MPSCNWSLLCAGAPAPDEGSVHAEDDAQLVVTFDNAGKLTVTHDDDGKTITIEGAVTLKKVGDRDIRFVGGVDIDTSGSTSLSGKLVFDLTKSASFELKGQANSQTGEMQAGGMLTITF